MLLEDLSRYKKDIIELSKIRFDNHGDDNGNYYYNQKKKIIQMMDILHAASHEYTPINKKLHIEASQIIDSTLRHCTNEALEITYYRQGRNKKNYNNYSISWDTVQFGLDLMDVQLRHGTMTDGKRRKILHPPYDTIPQTVCLQALKALNILLLKKGKDVAVTNSYNDITANTLSTANSPIDHIDPQIQHSNAAFRILQRMCTGIGIRTQNSSLSSSRQKPGRVQINLDERDFNMVLNGFVNTNQMNQAHRVIALQVRTEHAPPLSPITYSILIKGYGQLNDLVNVELCMKQCYGHGIRPDIVMFNSLIDAYINCDRIDLAHDIFHFLTSKRGNGRNREMNYSRKYFGSDEQSYLLYGPLNTDIDEEDTMTIPTANVRTYNTMLKGYVKDENIKRAMDLSREMQNLNLWDDITTNTLVSVSVRSNEFELAETLLKNHTKITPRDAMQNSNAKKEREAYRRSKKQHPNVEAYTELLNGYAKSKNLNKALSTLKLMRERGVHPNEFTYTCMIVALTKAHKIDQAKRMIDFMENIDGIRPGVVTYNAFLTGMLERQINDREKENDADDDIAFNSRVNEAGQILQSMMKSAHTRPNTVTAKTMIIALGNCKPSRVQEAKTLVSILEKERFGLISSKDPIIATALIRAYSNSLDYDGVESTYKSIHNPDTILLNAYIEGCCRCGKVKRALDIMADNNDAFRGDDKFTFPDVASYTILISAVLQIGTKSASGRALLLYNEMKRLWGILPDFALVDV
jgi:pentatricopeptide repeat protein